MMQGLPIEQMAPWLDQAASGFGFADAEGQLVFINAALARWVPATPLPVPVVELAARWGLRSPAGDPFIAEDVPPLRALRNAEATSTEVVTSVPGGAARVLLWEAWPLFPPGRSAADGEKPTGAASVLLDFSAYDRHRTRMSALLEQSRRELVTLSTPVLTLQEGMLLQPLIGSLSGTRGALALEELLSGIGRLRARVAIVDVTGVPEIDRATATQLIKALSAAALLGCEVVLTGIRPAVARMMTISGVDLSAVRVTRDVATALELARATARAASTGSPPNAGAKR
jgi:anti-anti-sigma regulatory factor